MNRGWQTVADVVFISYEEPNADENFARLKTFAPHAKRVHHIEGVYNAWTRAATLAETPRFFLVEGDNWILKGFEFCEPEYPVKADVVMWRARNAVNGLEAPNGCVKCLDREGVFSMDKHAVDLFLSIKGVRRDISRVVSETRFNTSPFLAWRCGFRECAKLVTGTVDCPGTRELLRVWQTVGKGARNGEWCMLGARMGAVFGRLYEGQQELKKVNDISWFKAQFEIISRRVGSASPLAFSPLEILLPRA